MTPERIAECKKICACVPFVEPGAGVDETQRAMRELIAQVEEDAEMTLDKRYVLGEGYGLGKGILSDTEHKGAFAWVGLTAEPGGTTVIPLVFPNTSRIVGGKIDNPSARRKFRLVLEVIEEAKEPA